jgi:hypothetical protein
MEPKIMLKSRTTVVLLLLLQLPIAAGADTQQDPMLSGCVLNVTYDGAMAVKVDIRAEVYLLYGVQFPEPKDNHWMEARRLCRKMGAKGDIHCFIITRRFAFFYFNIPMDVPEFAQRRRPGVG